PGPAVRPTRASEGGFLGIPNQPSGPQGGDAFPLNGPPIRLPLMSVERPAVVGDLRATRMPRNIPRWIYRADVGPRTRIVLVEAKNEGNVGAVARAMKNFDASDLVLVNPCPLGIEARQRAMHGVDILESARVFPDLASALKDADLIVGTSGIDTESEKRFPRIAIGPRDLAIKVHDVQGTIALLFGREDFGLLDEELRQCDLLVKVPASTGYPILNLSHAATILLYELFGPATSRKVPRAMSGLEKENLHAAFADLLRATEYPV